MSRFAQWMVVLWLVATTAHLPFPVCDGDRFDSAGFPDGGAATGPDIDFVLLGCDAPDDSDDGPIDDDPESAAYAYVLGVSHRSDTALGAQDFAGIFTARLRRLEMAAPRCPEVPRNFRGRLPETTEVMRC